MRSAVLLTALAANAVSALERSVYVTDWTTVTVTKTVTVSTATETDHVAHQVQFNCETTTLSAAPVEAEHSDLAKASAVESIGSSASAWKTALTTSAAEEVQAASESPSYWSTALTSTIGLETTTPAMPTLVVTSTSAGATATAANAYQQAVLYHHNIHRRNHSAPSVHWSTDLERSARALSAKCVYEHDTAIDGGGYGQNIGYGVDASKIGVMLTNLMYNDEMEYFPTPYGESNPRMANFEKWGHFSQIVWKGTTHVGCATVVCDGLGNVDSHQSLPFTVCNYSPAGNFAGKYSDNVLAPRGDAVYIASSECL
ncbi:CAP domain-containing protein [Penicillium atrosanguineum]|nr:CAP domain-containing protein [Penicillium atrosanguineum]